MTIRVISSQIINELAISAIAVTVIRMTIRNNKDVNKNKNNNYDAGNNNIATTVLITMKMKPMVITVMALETLILQADEMKIITTIMVIIMTISAH